ncbi:hypothetical protein StoSoilA2_18760 [Arthrobacter sp. StoSoilA2]|uniref:hypothetical protein n=1 Tax=Arthrobacter sp. StoSoilA2 TaxID=2830990 RepID=UPI001CC7D90A|nr:hypothetical protein [Arthrobacter sp. StoSoilA2]BCW35820.1 hypothetical protein StoSoilA2_18760 [Arthrobacter sp. StoSoilA2]
MSAYDVANAVGPYRYSDPGVPSESRAEGRDTVPAPAVEALNFYLGTSGADVVLGLEPVGGASCSPTSRFLQMGGDGQRAAQPMSGQPMWTLMVAELAGLRGVMPHFLLLPFVFQCQA